LFYFFFACISWDLSLRLFLQSWLESLSSLFKQALKKKFVLKSMCSHVKVWLLKLVHLEQRVALYWVWDTKPLKCASKFKAFSKIIDDFQKCCSSRQTQT
jgi:hypothetical protein